MTAANIGMTDLNKQLLMSARCSMACVPELGRPVTHICVAFDPNSHIMVAAGTSAAVDQFCVIIVAVTVALFIGILSPSFSSSSCYTSTSYSSPTSFYSPCSSILSPWMFCSLYSSPQVGGIQGLSSALRGYWNKLSIS
ncbi:hypothetical protein HOY80DRAFT_999789 [Tuber brumale]|nr:hypothetical protein HOY80DRAFT_999789 [Tuber brumale]